jgi:glycine hydroxymethyltransferase
METLKNAQALAARLTEHGYRIVSGGTDNHLMLVDLRPAGIDGSIAQNALDESGITVNKNSIPFDTAGPFKPSGIRIGTPAVTTRGMKEKDAEKVADFIHDAIQNHNDEAKLSEIREMVYEFNRGFPLPE